MKDGRQNWGCYTKRGLGQTGTCDGSPRGRSHVLFIFVLPSVRDNKCLLNYSETR